MRRAFAVSNSIFIVFNTEVRQKRDCNYMSYQSRKWVFIANAVSIKSALNARKEEYTFPISYLLYLGISFGTGFTRKTFE